VPESEIARLAAHFTGPPYRDFARDSVAYRAAIADSRPFSRWAERNVQRHKRKGYAIVTLSLKRTGTPPGDATAAELDAIADLAERYSFGERESRTSRTWCWPTCCRTTCTPSGTT
jgi:sulfite reductase (NADPH) hemoprotein beta-component